MPPSDPLSYDEIHSIQKRERSTRSLTKVPHDFYERLSAYVAEAKAGLEEESAKGASPRLVLLQGQFRNLQEMARDIMLLRLRKVTEHAFSAVEGGALAEKSLTPEELTFAKQVQGLVEATRTGAMREGAPLSAVAAPAAPPRAPPPAPRSEPPPARLDPPAALLPAPPQTTAPPKAAHAAAPAAPPVVLLRILDDVAPFEGENGRIYKLKREDVITLPREIAQILVRRKKAVEMAVPP